MGRTSSSRWLLPCKKHVCEMPCCSSSFKIGCTSSFDIGCTSSFNVSGAGASAAWQGLKECTQEFQQAYLQKSAAELEVQIDVQVMRGRLCEQVQPSQGIITMLKSRKGSKRGINMTH